MTMLAEHVDGVIGVDTHRDTLAAAAVSPIGAVLETTDAPAHSRGYQRLLDYTWNEVNKLAELKDPRTVTTYKYNNNDVRTTTAYPGGTVQRVDVDNSGRPKKIKATSTAWHPRTYSRGPASGGPGRTVTGPRRSMSVHGQRHAGGGPAPHAEGPVPGISPGSTAPGPRG
ncbi:hypothetical protein ACF061_37415 [Streptomyces sp. NPDC015220]|uniref:hypothetical protein n=1 Tax=Streptomyces sp. NPDC015220 TaxID=3364947 RepID=UPI0036F8CCA9